jgi:hypothetical protein
MADIRQNPGIISKGVVVCPAKNFAFENSQSRNQITVKDPRASSATRPPPECQHGGRLRCKWSCWKRFDSRAGGAYHPLRF